MLTDAQIERICPLPPHPDALPRVLTRAEATRRGFSRRAIEHRLATERWRLVLPRVCLTVDTLTEADRIDAALLFAGPGAALSSAAALRASDVPRIARPEQILVLVPPANRTKSHGFVQLRRTLRPIETVQWLGPRRVVVARAAADAALGLRSLDDARALIARVVQGGHCTVEELGRELEQGPRNGSGHLRTALREIGWGVESPPEARAARILRRGRITGFRPNAWLRLIDGSWRRVDFYWARLRAVLEIDSKQFHFEDPDWTGTLDRHLELSKIGVAAIHRPPSALDDEATFLRDIRAWLAGREADLRRGLA
jgi:hypothetical protein